MNKTQKAGRVLDGLGYEVSVEDNKLYVKAWNEEISDSMDFEVSQGVINKWANEFDQDIRKHLLGFMQQYLDMLREAIEGVNKKNGVNIFEKRLYENYTIGDIISGMCESIKKLQELEQQ